MFAGAAMRIIVEIGAAYLTARPPLLIRRGDIVGLGAQQTPEVSGILLEAGILVGAIPQEHTSLSITMAKPYINMFTTE